MKLHHIAIAACCAAAGSSTFAADFYLSGSSALKNVVQKSITNNCSTTVTYSGVKGSNASGPLDTGNGQSFVAYACTPRSGNTWGVTAGVAFNLFLNTQGSAYGVFPVASNTAIPFMDLSTCTTTGATGTCTGAVPHTPDAGVSDLEPTMFNDPGNQPVAAYANAPAGTVFAPAFPNPPVITTASFDSSKVAATQTFGLAVNANLLAALQSDQNLTGGVIPTVSSSALATIYSPSYELSGLGWKPLLTNGTGALNNQVNICSRLPGSGTLASARAFFLQAPFSNYSQPFNTSAAANNDTSTLGDSVSQNTQGGYAIGEYDNSGAVTGCLTNTQTNGGYAIGLLSTDRASDQSAADQSAKTNGFTFVNLDGSVPNTTAARFGKYQWVYEAFFQVNRNTANKTFANAFYAAFKTPANMTALGAPPTNGVMAAAANCVASDYTTTSVCAHVTRANARAALIYTK